MAISEEMKEILQQSGAVVAKIAPILSGLGTSLHGIVCAELIAMNLATWAPEHRDQALTMILAMVKDFVPVYADDADKTRNPQGNA